MARGRRKSGLQVLTSRIEHKSVLDPCRQLAREGFAIGFLEPGSDGLIDVDALATMLRDDTLLVSIMHANNETGVVQDIARIGALCRARGVPLHVDAAQSAGKIPLDMASMPVDLLSISAHKLYGPQGIGALYVRTEQRAAMQPLIFGGGHERGLRSGTLPVHQIVGCGVACELAAQQLERDAVRMTALRERLYAGLGDLPGVLLNGHATQRLPGILNLSFQGVQGESLIAGLGELAVSGSAACNSDSDEPSYVLRSLGRDAETAQASLRFSLGRATTAAEIEVAITAVRREVLRLRALAPRAGEAGAEVPGTRVRFELEVSGDHIREARFQAYGCPWTLSVCDWLAAELAGRSLADPLPGAPLAWAERLHVPPDRLGRLLVVEDALRAALQSHKNPAPARP
jgi:cysteine desulfurase